MTTGPAPLTPLAQATGGLVLTHTSLLHGTWELAAGDDVVARLRDGFTGRATADLAGASYVLTRTDWHGSFGVETTAGQRVASFDAAPWQPPGHLAPDRYHVVFIGPLPSEFRVSYGNTELVRVTQQRMRSAKRADVAVSDAGRRDPHLDVLMLLACHAYSSSEATHGRHGQPAFVGSGGFDPR